MNRLAQRGVTLIELMVVITVIGILASIAYPAYSEHIARARRAEAKGLLYDVLQRQERFFSVNGTFTTNFVDLGMSGGTNATEHNTHTMALAIGPSGNISTSVRMTAVPVVPDAKCGTLSLTSAHVKGASGTQPAICW
jgi:type IV pilus assembly protein PilE